MSEAKLIERKIKIVLINRKIIDFQKHPMKLKKKLILISRLEAN